MDDFKDDNRFTGRMNRYARVGGAVGGLAARLAGQRYLGFSLDRGIHAQELKAALGGLKGPLMKVAQILATIPDALPPEYAQELAALQANAPSMGWPFVRRRMATELGADWQKRFQAFERQAAAAASLGQVHRATLHDGREVACKLQYPDMASAVEADLKQLKLIFSLYRRYDRAIDPGRMYEEIGARLREELDYRHEARAMQLYGRMLAAEDGVVVPEPIPALSTDRLLTMSWVDGESLLSYRDAAPEIRNRIAQNMFRAWYVPFYEYGIIHGDPHLGNYSVRSDLTVNLLDFGCVRIFPPSFVTGVIELYHALRQDDSERAIEAYRIWGFEDLRPEVIEVLNIWARFIYSPLMEDKVQPIQDQPSGQYGAEVAHKVHEELRRLGGVRPPREFVFMDRAAIGLGAVFMHLRAEINWYQLFHDLIGDFDSQTLTARQAEALSAAGLQGDHPVQKPPPGAPPRSEDETGTRG